MEGIYRSPIRVYLVLAVLSLAGIFCAWKLPVSLFPNSSKPEIQTCLNIELAPDAFLRQYGTTFEERLRAIHTSTLDVETIRATYSPRNVCYHVDFKWGGDPQEALREVQTVAQNMVAPMPESVRNTLNVWGQEDNSGFLALSFYSPSRSLTEVYDILEPVLTPKLARISDSGDAELYNPQRREVLVELKPESLAAFNMFPNDVATAVLSVFDAYNGGSLTVAQDTIRIEFPKGVANFEDLKQVSVATRGGRTVTLGDLAHLDLAVPVDGGRIFKTSGSSSVMLWASPKPGGNVKEMAEGVMKVVDESAKDLPADIKYKTLVDPSEFIRSSVSNVAKEVAVAAGLAVFILFLFIGNVRNVATAAIEIPLSIVLAFILMRLSGMNLNLISLGGLALSAGMNVDASVVVMENIFRHFDLARARGIVFTFEERLAIISEAVREVRFAVIASTIASLVVFLPLAFTSALSYAILGDLAKAVVFSHGFSAVVALVLVPTIRLHLMTGSAASHDQPSVLENTFQRLENSYGRSLGWFLSNSRAKLTSYVSLAVLFVLLGAFVVPTLPREVIGKPDTDWLMLGVNVHGNTLLKQMEAQTETLEASLFEKFGGEIAYTFTQINRANSSFIMFRLRDKSHAKKILKDLEDAFPNTPDVSYWYDRWNPAELPLPNPPDFKVSVRGNDPDSMAETARDFANELRERKIFDRVQIDPDASVSESLLIRARTEQWPLLAAQGVHINVTDLADLTRAATEGKAIGRINLRNEIGKMETMNVRLRFPLNYVNNTEEIASLPVGLGDRIVPLKALASVGLEKVRPSIMRENGRELFQISAFGKQDERKETAESVRKAEQLLKDWPTVLSEIRKKRQAMTEEAVISGSTSAPGLAGAADAEKASLVLEDAQVELTDAIHQLAFAVSLSILLIFVVMVFQFGSIMNSLLVLVAIPLGFIGVVISLFVFQSTLSLNSMLGVILLNGLAVANSIILVDFLQKKVREGVAPHDAAVEVARVRLRPILMTSLTTGLGMLPVAFGFGEGGKILQPLGIAVAGGLGFSVITTLFIVPSLQVAWLEYRARRTAGAV